MMTDKEKVSASAAGTHKFMSACKN